MVNEPYWTYKAPPTPGEAPPDCDMTRDQWQQLSPGYRREIWRGYDREQARKADRPNQ